MCTENGSKSSMAIIDFFEGDIFSHIYFFGKKYKLISTKEPACLRAIHI